MSPLTWQGSVCAHLRFGMLHLAMETRSFPPIREENRKCLLCDRLFHKMSAECPVLLSISDECRPQYLFSDKKVFHLAQFVLEGYNQCMRALYVWCVKGTVHASDMPKLCCIAVISKEQDCVLIWFDTEWHVWRCIIFVLSLSWSYSCV